MLKLKISYVCKASHDSGNVKWTFPVNVGEEDTSSQKGKCHVGLLTLPLFLSTYPSPVWLDLTFFFFFLKSIYYKWVEAEKSVKGILPPIPRKGLLTFNSTNNIWKSPEM